MPPILRRILAALSFALLLAYAYAPLMRAQFVGEDFPVLADAGTLTLEWTTLAALTVPMATDIAFAMAVFGFFRSVMPLSSSAFLLTLATVDDLGAILVLATCFASNVAFPFLGGAALIFALLAVIGRSGSSDLKIFGLGGAGLWYCLLRSGVNSDVAGVLAAALAMLGARPRSGARARRTSPTRWACASRPPRRSLRRSRSSTRTRRSRSPPHRSPRVSPTST